MPVSAEAEVIVAIDLVGLVLDLDFGHEPPSARTARSSRGTERGEQLSAQGELGAAVFGAGHGFLDEFAADDLGRRAMVREQLVFGSEWACWAARRHEGIVAQAECRRQSENVTMA